MLLELVFIYNAKGGLLNGLFDSLHKSFLPETYSCRLCSLTHGFFGKKESWNQFIDEQSAYFNIKFYYKDDLPVQFQSYVHELPLIAVVSENEIEIIMKGRDFEKIGLEYLTDKLDHSLKLYRNENK